jgi:hypothetical protein
VNLSKNSIFVNKNFIKRFESIKLRHKSAILIDNNLFFFILPKEFLIQYKRDILTKLADKSNIVTIALKKKKDKHFVPDSKMLDNMDSILCDLIETSMIRK